VLVLCLSLSGCTLGERWNLTKVEDFSEDQMWITAVIGQQCSVLGVNPLTGFTDDEYIVAGSLYGETGKHYTAAMWALAGKNMIMVWNPILDGRYTDEQLISAAQHECCHIKLGHRQATAEAEEEAVQCEKEFFGSSIEMMEEK